MNLETKLETIIRLTPQKKAGLKKLGVETARDLLTYLPARYEEFAGLKKIRDLIIGESASIIGEIENAKAEKTWRKKMLLAEAVIKDETGTMHAVWFGQPYLANMLKPAMRVRLSGKVQYKKGKLFFTNPTWEFLSAELQATNYKLQASTLLPVYSETYGVSSLWLRMQIQRLISQIRDWPEILPEEILKKYHLPDFERSVRAIHFPRTLGETEAAKKRFSFEEVFFIQLDHQLERAEHKKKRANPITPDSTLAKEFISSLPFPLTNAQQKVIWQIFEDIKKPEPMARLLEGDVGSGKTLVAAAIALQAAKSGLQSAIMAPTEILARQHFYEFMKRLEPFRVRIGLLTSSESQKFPSKIGYKKTAEVSKAQLLKFVASGDIQILIGTHALIQDKVKFKKLAFVVIDEQHRFGTEQRARLAKEKEEVAHHDTIRILKPSQIGFAKAIPHLLSMTATPIPRTLALTIFGNLDLSVLDEMPPGRKKIITKVVPAAKRSDAYEFIRREIHAGRQAFVICPRIEKPDGKQYKSVRAMQMFSEMKAVKQEYEKLSKEIFPEFKIAMLHGKLAAKEKEKIMKQFKGGETHILVSTSVVEVGVDIPNATIMMIEGGERFGLAQLHQFRGRVGRGEHQSYCFVFTDSKTAKTRERLKALETAKNGFELAEYDLQFRGAGELSGARQWGMSDAGMEALKNIKMVEAAREEAAMIVNEDPNLKKYPLLKERLERISQKIHFE
ncbi:MAG: ATP-dependent DNA helicase RecG [bacterium]|nr:ATP-dependent DNA helicase RecG [bacterium]